MFLTSSFSNTDAELIKQLILPSCLIVFKKSFATFLSSDKSDLTMQHLTPKDRIFFVDVVLLFLTYCSEHLCSILFAQKKSLSPHQFLKLPL